MTYKHFLKNDRNMFPSIFVENSRSPSGQALSLCEENNEKSNASSSLGHFITTIGAHPSRTQIKTNWFLRRPMWIFRRPQRSNSTEVKCWPRSGHLTILRVISYKTWCDLRYRRLLFLWIWLNYYQILQAIRIC